jgi:hypothetical protein
MLRDIAPLRYITFILNAVRNDMTEDVLDYRLNFSSGVIRSDPGDRAARPSVFRILGRFF